MGFHDFGLLRAHPPSAIKAPIPLAPGPGRPGRGASGSRPMRSWNGARPEGGSYGGFQEWGDPSIDGL